MNNEHDETTDRAFTVKRDLLKSLERSVDHQVDGVRESTNKQTRYIRVDLIFVGLILTALSFILEPGAALESLNRRIAILIVSIGIGFLFISIGYSIKAQLGSSVHYSTFYYNEQMSPDEYYNGQITEYNRILEENQSVLEDKIKTDRVSLSTLLAGMSLSGTGALFVIFDISIEIQFLTTIVLAIAVGYFVNKILSGDFDRLKPDPE